MLYLTPVAPLLCLFGVAYRWPTLAGSRHEHTQQSLTGPDMGRQRFDAAAHEAETDAYIERLVAAAPVLGPQQRARLRSLLALGSAEGPQVAETVRCRPVVSVSERGTAAA